MFYPWALDWQEPRCVGCCWARQGCSSIVTCSTFLGKGPCLPQGSWWCVLRVRSGCLSTERAGLPAGVPSLGAIGLSVIPGWTQLYCCAKSLFSPPWYSLCHELIHTSSASCFPTPFTFLHLAPPSLPFRFLSLHTFTLPSHGYFPLFPLSFHPLMHCLFLGD